MRGWFAHTADHISDGVSEKSEPYFTKLSRKYAESGVRYRAPLTIALFSVAFQKYPLWTLSGKLALHDQLIHEFVVASIVICALLAALARTSRLAVAIYIVIAVIAILPDWTDMANHDWLAFWTIPVAVLFREWWKSDSYSVYLRATLGIVMIAAFLQKVM